MASVSEDSLRLLCDSVLVRSILVLRHALKVMEQDEDVPADSPHTREIRESIQLAEAECRRRGLDVPNEPLEGGFLRGIEVDPH